MDTAHQHGQRVDQAVVETVATGPGEEVQVRQRVPEVFGDEDCVERRPLSVGPLIGDADEIDDGEVLLLQVLEELELPVGEDRVDLLEGKEVPIVFDESDDVAVTATRKPNGHVVGPFLEGGGPRKCEEVRVT